MVIGSPSFIEKPNGKTALIETVNRLPSLDDIIEPEIDDLPRKNGQSDELI
jgi:hypothetical protein